MIRYIAGRLVQAVVVLLVMSFVIYGLIGLMPGDPIDLMISADPRLTTADAARLKALYGLDRPLVERYGAWLQAALSGELGYSRLHLRPVGEVILPRLANTLLLLGLALALALAVAVPAGVRAARFPGSAADRAIGLFCFAGISLPSFWFALLLILVFAVGLGWLPASGVPTAPGAGLLEHARHLVLPVVTLALASLADYTRHVRAATILALRDDYIRTARAKGAAESRVVWGHALPNALVPAITLVALDAGALFSGALIAETMFAYPGMGKLIYDSILGSDFNVALAALLLATLVTLLANLAADLAYTWLDPRVTLEAGGTP